MCIHGKSRFSTLSGANLEQKIKGIVTDCDKQGGKLEQFFALLQFCSIPTYIYSL